MYFREFEGSDAHGYPFTTYLQLSLLYGCGVYTAREQGVFHRTQFYGRFWKHHYFDWTTFARRGIVVAGAGGLVAGTIMFGNPTVSLRRLISKYQFWTAGEKSDDNAMTSQYWANF